MVQLSGRGGEVGSGCASRGGLGLPTQRSCSQHLVGCRVLTGEQVALTSSAVVLLGDIITDDFFELYQRKYETSGLMKCASSHSSGKDA